MKLKDLKNTKIAIVGFGREGKSLAYFLKRKKIKNITILDQNPSLKISKIFAKQLGKNYLRNLDDFDLIFLSPGISPHLEKIKKVHPVRKRNSSNGVKSKISTPTNLFFDLFKGKIIGATGTKGKGTTARLIYKILKKSFPKKKIFLGGNIGRPLISLLEKTNKNSIVVAELSSFQLQFLKKSPQVAVVTNLERDHLNYHQSLREYHQAKLNILRFQKKKDLAVINSALKKKTENLGKGKKYYFGLKREAKGKRKGKRSSHWELHFLKSRFLKFRLLKFRFLKYLIKRGSTSLSAGWRRG